MTKKYIIRASEVIEYVAPYEADSWDEAKSKFSQELSSLTWYKHGNIEAKYTGFQWDICSVDLTEVSDDESGSRKPKKKR
tara:strand:- start:510 stop:749 length:240 start_codon:yes stop_codon:yes gene_type:complete